MVEPAWRARVAALGALVIMLALIALPTARPAQASSSPESFEQCLLQSANQARADAGVEPLRMATDIVPAVRDWSRWMRFNEFRHMSYSMHLEILPPSWIRAGENIAMHGDTSSSDCERMHTMWMNSASHRSNILNHKYRFVAMGAYGDSSGWWGTQFFFDARDYSPGCEGAGAFCDDDGSAFESAIERLAAAGITQGCNPPDNTRFCPDDYVTRGQMAAFLDRALELPAQNKTNFADDNHSVFESAIERLAAAGITQGCNPPDNTRFCPDDYVTRGQMAAFLDRALELPAQNKTNFADDNHSVFESAIERLAAAGITRGCNPPDNTRFCPDDYVTRGQMAAFIIRSLEP